jgi:hypothetical protein
MGQQKEAIDISAEWQNFLTKSFSMNCAQFGLAAYLSTFGDHAEVGWNRVFAIFSDGILKTVDDHSDYKDLSPELKNTLVEAGVINNRRENVMRELELFESGFKFNVVAMAKKLNEFRENQLVDQIKKALGD